MTRGAKGLLITKTNKVKYTKNQAFIIQQYFTLDFIVESKSIEAMRCVKRHIFKNLFEHKNQRNPSKNKSKKLVRVQDISRKYTVHDTTTMCLCALMK